MTAVATPELSAGLRRGLRRRLSGAARAYARQNGWVRLVDEAPSLGLPREDTVAIRGALEAQSKLDEVEAKAAAEAAKAQADAARQRTITDVNHGEGTPSANSLVLSNIFAGACPWAAIRAEVVPVTGHLRREHLLVPAPGAHPTDELLRRSGRTEFEIFDLGRKVIYRADDEARERAVHLTLWSQRLWRNWTQGDRGLRKASGRVRKGARREGESELDVRCRKCGAAPGAACRGAKIRPDGTLGEEAVLKACHRARRISFQHAQRDAEPTHMDGESEAICAEQDAELAETRVRAIAASRAANAAWGAICADVEGRARAEGAGPFVRVVAGHWLRRGKEEREVFRRPWNPLFKRNPNRGRCRCGAVVGRKGGLEEIEVHGPGFNGKPVILKQTYCSPCFSARFPWWRVREREHAAREEAEDEAVAISGEAPCPCGSGLCLSSCCKWLQTSHRARKINRTRKRHDVELAAKGYCLCVRCERRKRLTRHFSEARAQSLYAELDRAEAASELFGNAPDCEAKDAAAAAVVTARRKLDAADDYAKNLDTKAMLYKAASWVPAGQVAADEHQNQNRPVLLEAARLKSAADNLQACRSIFEIWGCQNCGSERTGALKYICQERLCAHCGRKRQERNVREIRALIEEQGVDPAHLSLWTVTVQNTARLTKETWGELAACWNTFRAYVDGARGLDSMRGGFRGSEVTAYDVGRLGHNNHLHAMVEHEDRIPQPLLSDMWFVASRGAGYVFDVSRLLSVGGGVRETVKSTAEGALKVGSGSAIDEAVGEIAAAYTAKVYQVTDPRAVVEIMDSLRGVRLIEKFGRWRDYLPPEEEEEVSAEDDGAGDGGSEEVGHDGEAQQCECGAKDWILHDEHRHLRIKDFSALHALMRTRAAQAAARPATGPPT